LDDLFDLLNFKLYFEEMDIKSILEKILSKLKNKNYYKIKLEYFFITLFVENSKNISKFLVDFFIRYENNLQNYLEIFSKDIKKLVKRLNDEESKITNTDMYNRQESKNKDQPNNQKENLLLNYKRFFDLNFRKIIFITDQKNQILRAKIFTKILKTIIRCKGMTLYYKLLVSDTFDINKDFNSYINIDISNEIDSLKLNKFEKSN
jgi:hypothetical protein